MFGPGPNMARFQLKRQQHAQKVYRPLKKEVPAACTSCKLPVERDGQKRPGTQRARPESGRRQELARTTEA